MMLRDRRVVLLLLSNALASVGTGIGMIAVPWLLASGPNGDWVFGTLMSLANVGLFLLTPFIGPYIDSLSRKRMMIWLRVLFVAGLVLVWGVGMLQFEAADTFSLVVYYLLGASFYAVNIPLRTAFVQEMFRDGDYLKVNSVLEVENQVAAVATGAIAAIAVEYLGLESILLANAGCYIVAVACIVVLPYQRTAEVLTRRGVFGDMADGLRIVARRPALAIMLAAASIPYVGVILYTYIHPTALARLVDASSSSYAIVEMLFGAGAILGGWAMIAKPLGGPALRTGLGIAIAVFTFVALIQASVPTYWSLIGLAACFGMGNAVVRIMRQSLLMEEATPEEIGRIGALLQSWIMFSRASCLIAVTSLTTQFNAIAAMWFVGALSLIAFIFYFSATRNVVTTRQTAQM